MSEQIVPILKISDIHKSKWNNLSDKKIYFGHQSVGFNIVDGIYDVMKNNMLIKLNVLETNEPSEFNRPVFAHSRIGENIDPISKNDDFVKFIENGIGNRANYAFYKYCYIDIQSGSDVNKLFDTYSETLAQLKKEYPETIFIHVTVPLVVVQKGWRVFVKKAIGRAVGGYAGNIKRNQFNKLMRNEYKGVEPVFDLARIEATFPDGKLEYYNESGKKYFALVPQYASDGRHLNEKGRRVVAEQLLIFLANLSDATD